MASRGSRRMNRYIIQKWIEYTSNPRKRHRHCSIDDVVQFKRGQLVRIEATGELSRVLAVIEPLNEQRIVYRMDIGIHMLASQME